MSQPVFILDTRPLGREESGLGQVAVVPWDTEIFGFAVGDYKVGNAAVVQANFEECRQALQAWARERKVRLVSCNLPGDAFPAMGLLQGLGFSNVDSRIRVTHFRLEQADLSRARIPVRPAEEEDYAEIERIAGTAFRFGRYHTDPHFPEKLANRRYQVWVRRALTEARPGEQVYVIGPPGQAQGFFHVVLEGGIADLRLGAVDPARASGLAGFNLYAGTLKALRNLGARQATAIISPANTRVMNLYASLGFRFSEPEAVYHWHAPEGSF